MQTEDAYSSGHLVLSQFGTCICSDVKINLSWTCLVSGLLSFEHHSVLLFCLLMLAELPGSHTEAEYSSRSITSVIREQTELTRATLLFLTRIYSCQSGMEVNLTLLLINDKRGDFNCLISNIPFFRTIPFSPACCGFFFLIQQLKYEIPRFAPLRLMDVSFRVQRDFPISVPNRDTSRNSLYHD